MNYNDLDLLKRIYNTLLLISTKGEDTMIMGECLHAFQNFLLTKQQVNETVIENKEEE
jgi:hypothetical protein